ncbi:hypothetical protein DFJ43DRAFT_845292 [Lentinula guzmanii]|uniref:Uncharacterized protein n=1 Tax=Lentinula guzmanii TaxID=2804957 RepID=A0AA38J315_9AGAR|nr:hypothetical protein DFJ43DRAFT_845292 [Lentinula guzmanii]
MDTNVAVAAVDLHALCGPSLLNICTSIFVYFNIRSSPHYCFLYSDQMYHNIHSLYSYSICTTKALHPMYTNQAVVPPFLTFRNISISVQVGNSSQEDRGSLVQSVFSHIWRDSCQFLIEFSHFDNVRGVHPIRSRETNGNTFGVVRVVVRLLIRLCICDSMGKFYFNMTC